MTDVQIVQEPLTYNEAAPFSFFRDLALARSANNPNAEARLRRHGDEMRVELAKREQRLAAPEGVEYRTNPNRVQGQGGTFSPPAWLLDAFAAAPRPGRVLADMAPNFPLPAGTQSINVPRMTTGTIIRPVQDLAAAPERDVTDAGVFSPVVAIAGQSDVALQLLEQSPAGAHLDHAFFMDLMSDYDFQLERQLLVGSGQGGEMLGILNVPGINQIVYNSATPTATSMFGSIGQVAAAIGRNRRLPPEVWMATTPRWVWIGSSEDTASRPLMLASHDGNDQAGSLLTFPLQLNDAIPVTLTGASQPVGLNGTQDAIIACRPSDLMVLESEPKAEVFLEVLSGTLQARMRLHRYVAGVTGRYPSGIGVLSGTGMVPVAGF